MFVAWPITYLMENPFRFSIGNKTDFVLATELTSRGWDGVTPVTVVVTVSSGAVIQASSTSVPAFLVDNIPAGSNVTIINKGEIVGKGGAGGAGGFPGGGFAGGAGGTALKTTATIDVDNQGEINGGGGGGGGGGTAGNAAIVVPDCFAVTGGAGGAGGAGYGPGSAGGGSAGSTAGDAGCTQCTGGTGGSGGGKGAVGNAGAVGQTCLTAGNAGGSGGAAGFYADGFSKITWLATGTRNGNITG